MADEEIIQDITALLTTGVSCIYHDEIRMDPLGQIYCLPCDPNQPAYIRDVHYTTTWPTSGGGKLQSSKNQTVLVCDDWAEYSFVTKGDGYPLSMYDKCGLDVSAPCTDSNNVILTGRNRYVCGDNKIYPSVTYTSQDGAPLTPLQAVEALLNDYQIGVRSMNRADFTHLILLQTPLFDAYGFKIITNVQCTDLQAATPNPDCWRTYEQMLTLAGATNPNCANDTLYAINNPAVCGPVRAEQCYRGSSAASAGLSVTALAAAVILLLTILLN